MKEFISFLWVHIERVATYMVELIVLVFIYKELRELKRHSTALAQHEGKLDQVRPLLSTLYTDSNDILKLAIDFTRDAKHIQAVGTISVLAETEIRSGEEEIEWKARVERVLPLRREYVAETLDFIHSGRPYYRVMNFSPQMSNEPELLIELWANVKFFLRIFEDKGAKELGLHIFHDPSLVAGKEDFHYRVSDSSVIIRVGGPMHSTTNAAIAIRDSKVIETFASAYSALLERPRCREINIDLLRRIDECLAIRDIDGIENALEEVRK